MENKLRVSIIILSWNSAKFLRPVLKSIAAQTYTNIETIVIDNGSRDDSAKIVAGEFPQVKLIKNKKNRGFCAGNNQGVGASSGNYVFFLNSDIVANPDLVEKLFAFAENNPRAGAVQPKLLHYDFDQNEKTSQVDCYEIKSYKSRRFIDLGQGLPDDGRHEKSREIFGATGAAFFARRKALEETKIKGQYFAEYFGAYKEDIDLSWRLRLGGWEIWTVPQAIGYHGRTSLKSAGTGYRAYIANEKKKPLYVRQLSPRNHYLMQVRCEWSLLALLGNGAYLWREFRLLVMRLFFEPRTLKAYFSFLRHLPRALRERKIIQARRKAKPEEINKWFEESKSEVE